MKTLSRACCLVVAALLAACGGSGAGGGSSAPPAAANCSATAQKQFVLDASRQWYLFPELLPASVNLASYATAQELLDALTATARAQSRDRFFSYLTTPQADSSFLLEGQFIGFGFRTRISGNQLFVPDAYEDSPAAEAGLARGAEIREIDAGSGFVPVATLLQTDPTLSQAFGPATEGIERRIRFLPPGGGSQVEARMVKRVVTITPVPLTGGSAILTLPSNPSVQVGYVNLRTFISTADAPLRSAFAQFRAQGIRNFIIDVRYNGGGLVSVAELVGDLLGQARSTSEVFSQLVFNPGRSSSNTTRRFNPQPQSVNPVRIAFVTTGASASASEMVVNSMKSWAEVAIVGSNTFGKPVGQSAFDLNGCDVRLRLVAFRQVNAQGQGDYYTGLASTLPFACAAADEVGRPMHDPAEASTRAALDWLGTGACGQVMTASGPGQQKPGAGPAPGGSPPASAAEAYLPGLQ